MKKETRTVVYDEELRVEAYRFQGIARPLPNHFHEYYVIGFKDVMLDLAEEVTGKRELPGFSRNVIRDEAAACCLRPLHELVTKGSCEFGKEERLLLLISLLIQQYGQPFESYVPEDGEVRWRGPAPLWNSTMPSAFLWIRYAAARGWASPPCYGPLPNTKGSRRTAT